MVGRSDPEFSLVSEQLLHSGYAFDLYSTSWIDSSGEVFERDIVRHRGAVAIVPLTDDQAHVLLVRQFRTPLNAWLLELPAGLRDKEGESEFETARADGVEEESMTVEKIPLADVGGMIADGEITDAKTVAGLLLAQQKLALRSDG